MSAEAIRLSKHLQEIAKNLEEEIEACCYRKVGFTLIVFTDERASYISNVNREQSVGEIKNLLELWEQGMPDVKAHEVQ